ncbi:Uncharacterized protein Fot_32424 [Forsythia ovata]|uniref:Uncharacterized protein n=1 Tax=Forsythia ovata TaxID=205694 RepID=A0ABD1T7T1_9LAMI
MPLISRSAITIHHCNLFLTEPPSQPLVRPPPQPDPYSSTATTTHHCNQMLTASLQAPSQPDNTTATRTSSSWPQQQPLSHCLPPKSQASLTNNLVPISNQIVDLQSKQHHQPNK